MMKKKIIFLMAALAVTCGGLFAASINNVSAVKKIPTRYDWLDHHRGENWTGGRTITAKEGAEIVRAAKSYKGRPYNGFVCTQLVKAAFGKTRISPMVNVSKRNGFLWIPSFLARLSGKETVLYSGKKSTSTAIRESKAGDVFVIEANNGHTGICNGRGGVWHSTSGIYGNIRRNGVCYTSARDLEGGIGYKNGKVTKVLTNFLGELVIKKEIKKRNKGEALSGFHFRVRCAKKKINIKVSSDKKGIAVVRNLPLGVKYVVSEEYEGRAKKYHRNKKKLKLTFSAKKRKVTVKFLNTHNPVPKEPKEYKFRIQKKDSDGGFSIKEAGFKFRIKNEETGKYLSVSAKGGKDYKEDKSVFTTGPDGKTSVYYVRSTEHKGSFDFSGSYVIEEVEVPKGAGYKKDADDESFAFDEGCFDGIREFCIQDGKKIGVIEVEKYGEVLKSIKEKKEGGRKIFEQEIGRGKLKGVSFALEADQSFSKNDTTGTSLQGQSYTKGNKITELTSNDDGYARVEDLPLGRYRIREIAAPHGYEIYKKPMKVDLKAKEDEEEASAKVIYDDNSDSKALNRLKPTVGRLDKSMEKGKKENPIDEVSFGLVCNETIKAEDGSSMHLGDITAIFKQGKKDGYSASFSLEKQVIPANYDVQELSTSSEHSLLPKFKATEGVMKKENKLKTTYKFIIEKREKGKKDEDLGVIKAEGFRFKIKDLETNKFIKAGRKPDSNYKEDVEEFVTQKNGETEEYYLKEDGNGGSYKPQNRYEIVEVATPKNSPFANDSKPQRLTPKRMDSSGKAKHRIFDSRLKKNAKKKITKPTKGDAVSGNNKAPKTGRFTGDKLAILVMLIGFAVVSGKKIFSAIRG